jgi:hypothetical protein
MTLSIKSRKLEVRYSLSPMLLLLEKPCLLAGRKKVL